MRIEIKPYTEDMISAVRDFNDRLDRAKVKFRFRLQVEPTSPQLPFEAGRRIYQERYLAMEGDQVRGGYCLNRQEVAFRGEAIIVGSYVVPISEGSIDRRYSMLAMELVRDAMKRSPRLFGLGIGGLDVPIARIFKSLGWTLRTLPFHFGVRRPFRFLRNVQALRRTPARALAADLAAFSGLGWVAMRAGQALRGTRSPSVRGYTVEIVDHFDDWADKLWAACVGRYSMVAARDSHALNIIYPREYRQYTRLRISEGRRVLGWAVVSERQREEHQSLGNMRVGTVMDCFGLPEDAGPVTRAAVREISRRDVDIVVANQAHPAWARALHDAGLLDGPSDCVLAMSPELSRRMKDLDESWSDIHVSRDGRPR